MLEFKDTTAAELETFKKSHSIENGNSPFVNGLQFTVTEMSCKTNGKEGEERREYPTFKTNVGDLFLSSCIQTKVTFDHQVVSPNGTFNQLCRDCIARGGANEDIMNNIIKGLNGKKVQVTRVPYVAISRDRRPYPAYLMQLDIVQ